MALVLHSHLPPRVITVRSPSATTRGLNQASGESLFQPLAVEVGQRAFRRDQALTHHPPDTVMLSLGCLLAIIGDRSGPPGVLLPRVSRILTRNNEFTVNLQGAGRQLSERRI